VDAVVVGAEDALSGVDAAGVGALVEVVLVAVGVGVEVVLAVNELVTAGVVVGAEDALRCANSGALRVGVLLELKDG
jgi:hypothetical protein